MARSLGCLLVVALILAGVFLIGRDYVRRHPQDVPWTALDLNHPVGRFTASKIARLGDDPAHCRALLTAAGVKDLQAPPRSSVPECSFGDGMRLAGRRVEYSPQGLVTSCPVAAALHLLEARVIQPAAQRHFGRAVRTTFHAGSFSCRRLYGRSEGRFSEHATADAVDITGFSLADGRRLSVLDDWDGGGPEAAFLREVRDGACRLFSTVLSPDYNAAHRDHFHLDVADRGSGGWTMCR
ncbi:MAG TPA: extensin family protein [Sphingomicrobium sp.]|nr:extensin family protein [Sphingomicrobium sp.]